MAYIVLENMIDLEDGNRLYLKGETWPRPDMKPAKARVDALLSGKNAAGRPMIAKAPRDARKPAEGEAGDIPEGSEETDEAPAEG